jgi:hypothetical protein
MIKHIVMWKLKAEAENKTLEENAKIIKKSIEDLKNKIKEIKKIEVGININTDKSSFDAVLYSEFEDEVSLEKYLKNPEHLKVAEFLSKIREERIIVDYKI